MLKSGQEHPAESKTRKTNTDMYTFYENFICISFTFLQIAADLDQCIYGKHNSMKLLYWNSATYKYVQNNREVNSKSVQVHWKMSPQRTGTFKRYNGYIE